MSNEWETDKRWADKYLSHQKTILAERLIVEGPVEEDRQRNTDLVVLRMDTVRVGCRVRKPGMGYLQRYPFDVTFRCERPSGAETELAKMVNGWGDYMLYGFADEGGSPRMSRWVLIDLAALRAAAIRHPGWFRSWATSQIPNRDDSSLFVAMDTRNEIVTGSGLIAGCSDGYWDATGAAA